MVLWSQTHYSGEVDLMSGISYLPDLVDLPCGGGLFINQELTLLSVSPSKVIHPRPVR